MNTLEQKLEDGQLSCEEATELITKTSPDHLGTWVSNLLIDHWSFAKDRLANEAAIAELRLKLDHLNIKGLFGPSKERAAEHEEIVAEMLELQVENLFRGFLEEDIIDEVLRECAARSPHRQDFLETQQHIETKLQELAKELPES
jgi:hypothetical protein